MVPLHPEAGTFIVVPIPLSVARQIGCRHSATIRLHIVDGVIKVVPDTIRTDAPITQKPKTNTIDLWVTAQSWWKERAGNY